MRLLITLLNLFIVTLILGQGVVVTYNLDGDTLTTAKAICETKDHGYVLTSQQYNSSNVSYSQLIKTDIDGNVQWVQKYNFLETITSIRQTKDENYIITGFDYPGNGSVGYIPAQMYLVKADANGDTLWTKTFGDETKKSHALDVYETPDSGYLVGCHTDQFGTSNYQFYLIKTDINGNTLWTKTYDEGDTSSCLGISINPTSDGGYLLVGNLILSSGGDKDGYVVKIDANGNKEWSKVYDNGGEEILQTVIEKDDGGYIFVGSTSGVGATSYNFYVLGTDALGNILWTKLHGGIGTDLANVILEAPDGGYLIVGTSNSFYAPNYNTYLVKIDELGNKVWDKPLKLVAFTCIRLNDGYALLGHKPKASVNNRYLALIKMSLEGELLTNRIHGNVFNDLNVDCTQDLGDASINGVLVEAIGADTIYGTTDSAGNYSLLVDTGNYIIRINPSVYMETCSNSVPITITGAQLNDTIDFALQAQMNCALMQVDLAAPFLMNNGDVSRYGVSYCNKGTIDASDVKVKFIADEQLNILGTSIPISGQRGDTILFELGTVYSGGCGNFTIDVDVKTGTLPGQTHCSEVYISPDSICGTNGWSGPIIDATAKCLADTVEFKLYNLGVSQFSSQSYYVFEDHLILLIGNTGTINTNDSISVTVPVDTGKTYRIEIAQAPGFPSLLGDSIESEAIEGCVPYPTGMFNTGYVTQFSNGGGSPFNSIDCQENATFYNREDKSAQPKGYGTLHQIYNTTELDYKIRFQNTKGQPIQSIVVRDTISPFLDLSSLEMGASSHSYTWRVYGNRVLEIRFNDIMLPDSTTDALSSNAFVRYRIAQRPNNPNNTVIYNAATLYYDYDAPIITNKTWHRIGEEFVEYLITTDGEIVETKVVAYPNPFQHSTTLEVAGKQHEMLQLIVNDLSGRVVTQWQKKNTNRIEFQRAELPSGIYMYQLKGDEGWVSVGKIIIQ